MRTEGCQKVGTLRVPFVLNKGRFPLTNQPTSPDAFTIRNLTESLESHPEFDGHEVVAICEDPATGLQALIGIHSTQLGPSLGGSRRWRYGNLDEAITDVLRLSKGMSYKHAIAGTGMGGGKAVMLANGHGQKTPELMRAFGRFVDSMQGDYITAEDVGTSVEDMLFVKETTAYVCGLPIADGGSGDHGIPVMGPDEHHQLVARMAAFQSL